MGFRKDGIIELTEIKGLGKVKAQKIIDEAKSLLEYGQPSPEKTGQIIPQPASSFKYYRINFT